MINILLVENEPDKIRNISAIVDPFLGDEVIFFKANDINNAKKVLKDKIIDIMILDLYLPRTFGDEDQPDGGIRLLDEVRKSSFFTYPKYVISLSRYKDATEIFRQSSGGIHRAIFYDTTSNEWEKELSSCLEIAITILSNNIVHRRFYYDVAVICALEEEITIIKEILTDLKKIEVPYDNEIYYAGYFLKEGRKVKVVLSHARQMGMVAATGLATKIINNFIPKYLVMTGITGGTRPDETGFGDVIAATYSWDYRSGKDKREDGVPMHVNAPKPCHADNSVLDYCRHIQEDKEVLYNICSSFKGESPGPNLKLVIGPVASGASVVTDPQIVDDIKNNQDRDVLGIEMEIYGVYYAANWAIEPKPKVIALKSISDFADSDKGDLYHPYASYTSAKVFEILAREYFEYGE